jgi:hypothetical protein
LFIEKGKFGILRVRIGVHDLTLTFQNQTFFLSVEDCAVPRIFLAGKVHNVLFVTDPKYNVYKWDKQFLKLSSHEIVLQCLALGHPAIQTFKILFPNKDEQYKVFIK